MSIVIDRVAAHRARRRAETDRGRSVLDESSARASHARGTGIDTWQIHTFYLFGLLVGACTNTKNTMMIEGYLDDLFLPNTPLITILLYHFISYSCRWISFDVVDTHYADVAEIDTK